MRYDPHSYEMNFRPNYEMRSVVGIDQIRLILKYVYKNNTPSVSLDIMN